MQLVNYSITDCITSFSSFSFRYTKERHLREAIVSVERYTRQRQRQKTKNPLSSRLVNDISSGHAIRDFPISFNLNFFFWIFLKRNLPSSFLRGRSAESCRGRKPRLRRPHPGNQSNLLYILFYFILLYFILLMTLNWLIEFFQKATLLKVYENMFVWTIR